MSEHKLIGHEIYLEDENHTIGNLISDYMKHLYILDNKIDSNIITYASYKMAHPLKEIITLKLKLNDKIPLTSLQYLYKNIFLLSA